ncbi:hypothetical protein V5P93_002571 [Actinokineospora auranticolor]|uniref:Uncharacterized protein n=1 Tax=Actinokineospora auranticolor TaxID=155976 RepID=A0A2S6GMD0_9PSEU|nr:hypothetical protein [Actinokineospora auranticolor]PPK66399.1 hypothetical protein CLV40_110103 [Actinokineospora auranticolor]
MNAKGSVVRWRRLTVWLHVITSVGWMAQALTLVALMLAGRASAVPGRRHALLEVAHLIDGVLLAPFANAAAATGIALAGATSWGFFRHWWVTIKFGLTLVLIGLGIAVLSSALRQAAADDRVSGALVVGSAAMVAAIAAQVWLSVAKAGGRTPWAGRVKPGTAPAWVFAAAVLAPGADIVVSWVVGVPVPALSLLLVVVVVVVVVVTTAQRSTMDRTGAEQGV